jgi:hypothetical protein
MILVDGHVHIYDCFDLKLFLDSALDNFNSQAVHLGKEDDFTGILLLAETSRQNWFERLSGYLEGGLNLGGGGLDGWTFRPTNEANTLWAKKKQGQGFFLVAGRQIVTSENLEVLCLASEKKVPDGSPLEETIEAVVGVDGVAVIPWGFGKWTGKRGKTLKRALLESDSSKLFLGDNGGRPVFLPRPALFSLAEKIGARILPGTDPLPFPSEAARAGSFGFSIEGSADKKAPSSHLKSILLEAEIPLRPFGKLANPYRFLRNQLRMQLRKIG